MSETPCRATIERMCTLAVQYLADADILSTSLVKHSDADYLLKLTAFEIFLKALLRLNRVPPNQSHSYWHLFQRLPTDVQQRILSKAAERVGPDGDFSCPTDLLTRLGRNFVSLRYPYERYEGMSEEDLQRLEASWQEAGAPTETATFAYYADELFGLTWAVQVEIAALLGHALQ